MDCFSLVGKTAVVTGGLSGLGWAISRAMAEAGANIVLVDVKEPDENSLLDDIGLLGKKAMFIQAPDGSIGGKPVEHSSVRQESEHLQSDAL